MQTDELETPALLVNRRKMLRNIDAMQKVASKAGVNLRPHTKTHKSADLAKLQIEHGAIGIGVQKLGEAEAMAESGIQDVFITNEIVQPSKIQRILQLSENTRVKVAVDSLTNARLIGEIASKQGRTLPALLEIDCGMKRCGVPPGPKAVELAVKISNIPRISLVGAMTYEGHLYHFPKSKRRKEARKAISRVVETAKKIRRKVAGFNALSCGSTPSAETVAKITGVTEIQPGNYIFYDCMQVEAGSARPQQCALSVLTTVVSKPDPRRVVVDAGIKAFSFDGSRFPQPKGQAGLKPVEMYEEHLTLRSNRATRLKVGDRVEFIPYHACTTVNMHDKMFIVENNEVVQTCPVTARGRTV